MFYNTEGIVLRTIAYGESHVIVTLLTPAGRVAVLARGAKKPQSRLRASTQLLTRGMYSITQHTGMGTLGQAEVLDTYRGVRENLEMAAYAAYFCELTDAAAEDRPHGSQNLYQQFSGAIHRLQDGKDSPQVVARVWETKVLRMVGASPVWDLCVRCGQPLSGVVNYRSKVGGFLCVQCTEKTDQEGLGKGFFSTLPATLSQVLARFADTPWERLGSIHLKSENLRRLDQILRVQLTDYAGISLRSRRVLDSLEEFSQELGPAGDAKFGHQDESDGHQV